MKLKPNRGSWLWYAGVVPRRILKSPFSFARNWYRYNSIKRMLNSRLPGKPIVANSISIIVTSAGRRHYLEQTIDSLRMFFDFDENLTRWLIIDDDPASEETREYICGLGGFDLKLLNDKNMGLGFSLNRIYAELDTEFVFHCEDDWQFLRSIPIEKMIQLLRDNEDLRQLSLYNAPVKPKYAHKIELTDKGFAKTHSKTFTFNPHLARTQVFRDHFPFPLMYTELEYSLKLERAGKKISGIYGYGDDEFFAKHLGEIRSVTKY